MRKSFEEMPKAFLLERRRHFFWNAEGISSIIRKMELPARSQAQAMAFDGQFFITILQYHKSDVLIPSSQGMDQ